MKHNQYQSMPRGKKITYSYWYYFLWVVVCFSAVIGLVLDQVWLIAAGVFTGLFMAVNHYYLAYTAKHLAWRASFSQERLFAGEDNVFSLFLKNKGRFPVFHGDVTVRLSDPEQAVAWSQNNGSGLVEISLAGSSAVRYDLGLRTYKRGPVYIAGIDLEKTDFLGLNRMTLRMDVPLSVRMTVLPNITSEVFRKAEAVSGQASAIVPFSLLEDTYMRGSRPYQYGDPFNRIHWKQSAKHQTLYTKEMEKISEPRWLIFINLSGESSRGFYVSSELESLAEKAASLGRIAVNEGRAFDVLTNQKTSGRYQGFQLGEGEGKVQLAQALDMLALLRRQSMVVDPERVLKQLGRKRNVPGRIFHLGYLTDAMEAEYEKIKRRGTAVHVIAGTNGDD